MSALVVPRSSPSPSSARAPRATAPSCGAGRRPSSSTPGSPCARRGGASRSAASPSRTSRASSSRTSIPITSTGRSRSREKAGLPVYATAGTADAAGFPGPLFADVRTVRGGRDLVDRRPPRARHVDAARRRRVRLLRLRGRRGPPRRDGDGPRPPLAAGPRRARGTARCSASRRTTTRTSCARGPTRPSSSGASSRTWDTSRTRRRPRRSGRSSGRGRGA